MSKNRLLLNYLLTSVIILMILLGVLYLSFSLVGDILKSPQVYFNTDFSPEEAQFVAVYISMVTISVLISYIIYLLLASKLRVELMVRGETKTLTISREEFKRIYEESPVPYITLGKKGEIQAPNKAALRFFGVIPEEIEGKNLFSFFSKEDLDKAEKFLQRYEANIPINREEIRMTAKNGAIKWVLLSVFEMRNPRNFAYTGLATIFDITEEKRLDQAKTEFVSLASHQLRTPTTTIKWYADMLNSGGIGELSAKQKDYIEKIYKVNEETIGLIDTLLNVSKIEIGSLVVERKPTNVEELFENVLVELSSDIEKKKIHIDKHYNDSLKNIESDPKLLRIVIQNLLSNAVKYTPEAGTVAIMLKQSFTESTITVSDTGIGIPRQEQDRVFSKMFIAGNASGTSNSQSTGLGLYLVKSIMEAMGGSVSFVSEENKGSSFTIKF
jgi:PAS domain S-box-containing protein